MREDSIARKRAEITQPPSEKSGAKIELRKDVPAETANIVASNEREDDEVDIAVDVGDSGGVDAASRTLEDMMNELKLHKRSGSRDVEKKIKQRRR